MKPDVIPKNIIKSSPKRRNGFERLNKYLSNKNAKNGKDIKNVKNTIIETGFLKSFFTFYP